MTKNKETAITAALVCHGVYQYVRLPKEFRFEGDQVKIERYRNGVLLKPMISAVMAKRGKTPEH